MTTFPSVEPTDGLPLVPYDLGFKVEALDRHYEEDGIPYPVSGDVITRGKAEWDR